jgi:CheY-like chemotaxis protein/nitrogen-specific signal transduction histidine kinase
VAIGLYALRQFQELKQLSAQLNEHSRKIELQNLELSEASRLKSEFLASMSHELRTPLNAIIGFSEVLKDGIIGELAPDQLDYVEEIFKAGGHLLSLINDILDLTKIEAGKMELYCEEVELAPMVGNAMTIMKERAATGKVTLTQSIEPNVQTIEADGRKLRQIVYNLLSNAVKFTPEGGTVGLSLTCRGADIEIAVVDTGIGISAHEQKRLFRAFEQLDGGIGRQFEGTGLGLAMVKSLVELHGGTLGVESEVGRGSRFWVRLPCTRAAARKHQATETSLTTPAQSASSEASLILVIDDDPAALKLARKWLLMEGYSVEVATDCDLAWAAMQRQPPDAILLDILFAQGPDGWYYLEKLKQTPEFATIPVIIVSIVADLERGLALGAVAVLQKPVAGADLLRAVNSLRLVSDNAGEAVRILVVDDDPGAVEHVSKRLEQAGMHVTRCYGGAEALTALAAGGFSAMVLDLMMPEVTGFDVIRELRSRPATADFPVIVLTAKILEESERAALEQSVDRVMLKGDWDQRKFVQVVRTALHSRSRRQATLNVLSDQPRQTQPAIQEKQRHVLVIGDDQTARELLGLYLKDAGFAVTVTANSGNTLARLDGLRPDFIALDLSTPDMSGLSFLTELPEIEYLRGVPVLVVSSTESPEQALALGAQAVLSKPIRRHEFLEVVNRFVIAPEGRRPYVLVVDDDPTAVKIVTSYFSSESVDLGWAYGGREALQSMAQRRPDLLILDLMMPKVSGFDVLSELRGRPETAKLPVIILSAKEFTATERQMLFHNVQAVFAKATASRGDLLEKVQSLLKASAKYDGSNR